MTLLLRILIGAAALLSAGPASSGPGHDHGNAAPTSTATASPRFDTHSDLFEVVGILGVSELSIFVDRYGDNAPVLKARVEMDIGGNKAVGAFNAELGSYGFANAALQKPGTYPVTLTISAGDDVDILAGNLVVPDPHAGHVHEAVSFKWFYVLIAAIAIAAAVAFFLLRRRQGRLDHV